MGVQKGRQPVSRTTPGAGTIVEPFLTSYITPPDLVNGACKQSVDTAVRIGIAKWRVWLVPQLEEAIKKTDDGPKGRKRGGRN